ncbi:hypothetical protein FEE96_19450 [Parasedimentitalea maritima]|uniref:FecR protein domain-containing protein n=1 Tax=Parasedimentitalea maritima TaxID=2578117 RepID=A0ABY2URY1_9RHOB|nr:hypothetical protein [Zongyanglinia marina]TLP57556.1 hypothetical protein FEE96_19450 [Zongyanglinia marina]
MIKRFATSLFVLFAATSALAGELIFEHFARVSDGSISTKISVEDGYLVVKEDFDRRCYTRGQARHIKVKIELQSIGSIEASVQNGTGTLSIHPKQSILSRGKLIRVINGKDCGGRSYTPYSGRSELILWPTLEISKDAAEAIRSKLDSL